MSLELLFKLADRLDQRGATQAANAIELAVQESSANYTKPKLIYLASVDNLVKYASWFDVYGERSVADQVDAVLEKVAQLPPEKELYDYKAHRGESLLQALTDEVAKAKEPDLDTWKGGGHPLLTRYSPDYPGVMMYRVSDGVYQDLLSKKVYDFRNGFISDLGTRYYGGSVAYQTPNAANYERSPQIMESRHLRTRLN